MTCEFRNPALLASRRNLSPTCSGPVVAVAHQLDDEGSCRDQLFRLCTSHARQLVCFVDRVAFPAEGIESDRWGDRPISKVVAA